MEAWCLEMHVKTELSMWVGMESITLRLLITLLPITFSMVHYQPSYSNYTSMPQEINLFFLGNIEVLLLQILSMYSVVLNKNLGLLSSWFFFLKYCFRSAFSKNLGWLLLRCIILRKRIFFYYILIFITLSRSIREIIHWGKFLV